MSTGNENNPLVALSDAMADAVEKAGTATVLVDARRRLPASGVVIQSGYVITADHCVEREDDLSVTLSTGDQLAVSIAGRDPGNDLALLRFDQANVSVAEIAPQPGRVGQLALALGRPTTAGIEASLGVISAIGGPVRTGRGGLLEQYLRTDTIPYPGFSGGPLVDSAGRILGMNTSGFGRGGSVTIPIALASRVAETLMQHGHVRRGFLGIRSQPVPLPAAQQQSLGRQQANGLLLVGVETDSPAEKGGLMVGDILVALAGQPVTDPDELLARLVGSVVGQATPVQVLRGGQPATIQVTIGERGSA